MRVYIMTDAEGVAGVENIEDWVCYDSRYYELTRELLTKEVNAAIAGFAKAGGSEFLVVGGHGHGGINSLLLDERALYLSRGLPREYQFGMSEKFDAAAWIGQHAKAGALKAHLAHTQNHEVIDRRINDISVGEFGEFAMVAGCFGVPAIFGSGDKAFCEEAQALIPQIHTIAVKEGINETSGEDLNYEDYRKSTIAALHLHPNRARALIEEGAYNALTDFAKSRQNYKPFVIQAPYIAETWYRYTRAAVPYKTIQKHDTNFLELHSAPMIYEQP